MKHIIISNYGFYLGITSYILTIKKEGKIVKEIALNRVKTIYINTFNSFSANNW